MMMNLCSFSAFQYNTTVKRATCRGSRAQRFSAFQYNTTVKRNGSLLELAKRFSAFQYNTTVKLMFATVAVYLVSVPFNITLL